MPTTSGTLLVLVTAAAALGAPPARADGAAAPRPAPSPTVPAATALPPRAPDAPTATLIRDQAARAAPATTSAVVVRVPARRPVTGAPTVLPVLGTATDATGAQWLRVLLPGRPNGRTGFVAAAGIDAGTTPWAIEVRRSARRVLVRRRGIVVRRFRAIVGAPATPTPLGRFFVEETVRLPGRVAGPYALALSARSDVLQEFAGGPGQIALHGRTGLGGTLGTAVSHGCVRLGDEAIRWLGTRMGPGVRVTVTR